MIRPSDTDSAKSLTEQDTKNLTRREIEVLHLSAEGLSAKQVGRRLGIKAHTVSFYRGSIYGKLGVGCLLEAVRRCAVVTFREEYALPPEDLRQSQ